MTAEVCARTIDILEERGWCQHIGRDRDGRVCLSSGMVQAAKELVWGQWFDVWCDAQNAVSSALGWPVITWNDHPDRTISEVKELLKWVAAGELDTYRKLYGAGRDE